MAERSFLCLPTEIRALILQIFFSSSTELTYSFRRPSHFITTAVKTFFYSYSDAKCLSVLLVCKQLYREAKPLLISEVPVRVPLQSKWFFDMPHLPNALINQVKHVNLKHLGCASTDLRVREDLERFSKLERIDIDIRIVPTTGSFPQVYRVDFHQLPELLDHLLFGTSRAKWLDKMTHKLRRNVQLSGLIWIGSSCGICLGRDVGVRASLAPEMPPKSNNLQAIEYHLGSGRLLNTTGQPSAST